MVVFVLFMFLLMLLSHIRQLLFHLSLDHLYLL